MRTFAIAASLTLLAALPSLGAELIAGPVIVPAGADLVCTALNRGKKDIQLDFVAEIQGNQTVTDQGSTRVGLIQRIFNRNFTSSDQAAVCRFEFRGAKQAVQATASVMLSEGVYVQLSEAR